MPLHESTVSGRQPADRHLAMEIHPFTLTFKGTCAALEAPFMADYVSKSLTQVRLVTLLSAIFYALFAVLDDIVAPVLKYQLWFVRFGIVSPCILALFIFSFSPRFPRYMQPAIAACVIIGGLGIVYMTIIGNTLVAGMYYAGLMLVLMLAYSLVWARFIWATACGWVIVISYVAAAAMNRNLPLERMINNAFFCVSANIFGMAVGYAFEYYNRRDFYMRTLLRNQHREVEAARNALEARVNDRTRMLAKANEELRREVEAHQRLDWEMQVLENQLRHAQKMEAIGTLAGGIAHDFNNILAAIMGHTELAMMELTNRKEAEIRLSEVLNASHRAKELVGQILAFSRQSESERKLLKISLVIKEAMRLLKATLPSSITIQQQILASESVVVADATQIHQIVLNLCTNAAHAMAPKGGTLTITLENQTVNQAERHEPLPVPSQLADGEYVCLTIADTGHGIPEHLVERIFDPYFTTKAKGVGTGLGLAVVRGIVQNHGGLIQVRSEPDHGTRFRVYLPRGQGQGTSEFHQYQRLGQGSGKILLVDDEEGLAELGAKLLTTLGYRVIAYTEPETALAAVREDTHAFDLVITDMIMPGMSGEDLAREIIALRPDMPIIVYTGYTDLVSTETIRQMGVKAVLRKPITLYGLSQAIQKVLTQRSAEPKRRG
jgi:signal transduction histidine kinase/ActR/RegA family two-component response regulator